MNRPAFTLVELLVVVAVIGLLMAIAIPAVRHVHQLARTTRCLSNLKQLGVALDIYLDTREAKRFMPELYNRDDANDPVAAIDTVLLPDEPNSAVFACPADDRVHRRSGTSYLWNTTLNGQNANRLFSVLGVGGPDQPHRIPILSDKESFHPQLPLGVNLLFADYHVESNQTQFVTDQEPG